MVDKYLTRQEILDKYYAIEIGHDYSEQYESTLFFIEGGKKIKVQTYWRWDDAERFLHEDAIAHWLSMGRTWDEDDFFEERPEKSNRILKMRDDD